MTLLIVKRVFGRGLANGAVFFRHWPRGELLWRASFLSSHGFAPGTDHMFELNGRD